MTAAPIRTEVIAEKISYVRRMAEAIGDLPLDSLADFSSDFRNPAAGESYLRRALEALFDLGRHILAKGFARAPVEYKEIAAALAKEGVISHEEGRMLREMAGYRNRLVHFYKEIDQDELYGILRDNLTDVERLADSFVRWVNDHSDKTESTL
jgi:uncharacterized protein YutE (UPF0331/DUF86 family)